MLDSVFEDVAMTPVSSAILFSLRTYRFRQAASTVVRLHQLESPFLVSATLDFNSTAKFLVSPGSSLSEGTVQFAKFAA